MSKKKGNLESMDNAPNEIENISKIRDILFGNNMNEYEKRFEKLEDKLAQSIAENKADTDKKMSTLESFFKNEVKLLNNKLIEEEEAREKSDRRLLTELDVLADSLKKFKQSNSESFSDTNQQLLDLSNTISDQMAELNTSLLNNLESNSNQLQSSKMDRSTLAMMLTDLAYNIAGDTDSKGTDSE